MTVSLIRNTESHTGSTGSVSQASYSFACGIAGDTPKGIVVFTMQGVSSTEKATAVTYGGTSLTKITGGSAADTSTEPGRVTAWFLGASVPSGEQNVVVTRTNDTTPCYAVAFLLGGAADLVNAVTPVLQQESAAMTAVTIDPGTATAIVLAAGYTGGSTAPAAGTGTTLAQSLSGSYAYAFGAGYETTPTTGSRSRGLTAANDDRAQVVVGITEYVPPTYEGAFTTEAVSKVQTVPYYPAEAYPTFVGYSETRTPTYLTEPSSCTVPLGVEAGDVLFLQCWSGDLNNNTVTFQPQDPSSITWNAIGSAQRSQAAVFDTVQVFWRRVANASEAGTTITTYHTNESASFSFAEVCVAYRGCATSGDPWDDAVYTNETTAVSTLDFAALTVSGSNRTLLAIECHEDNTAYSTGPSGYSSRFSVLDTTGTDYSMGIWDYENQSSDGAVTVVIATTEVGATLHLSLKPNVAVTHEGAFTTEALSTSVVSAERIREGSSTTEALSRVEATGVAGWMGSMTIDDPGDEGDYLGGDTFTWQFTISPAILAANEFDYFSVWLDNHLGDIIWFEAPPWYIVANQTVYSGSDVLPTSLISGEYFFHIQYVSDSGGYDRTWEVPDHQDLNNRLEGAFTTESKSAVSAVGEEFIQTVTHEGALTSEALTLIDVTGTKTDWVAEGAFTTEVFSSVSATATKTEWIAEGTLTTEVFSAVSVVGQRIREATLSNEALSLVGATGAKTDWVAEATLTTEVFSTVTVAGYKAGTQEAELTSEALSLVAVGGSKTDWNAEGTFTTEILSTVLAAGSKTVEGAFTTEALSTVGASATKTEWVAEGAFTTEVFSLVDATGSKTDWIGEGAFTTEALSSVSATAAKNEWIAEAAFTTEALTEVSIIGSEASAVTREGAFTTEAVSLVDMRPWWWIEEFDDYTEWTASSGTLSSDSVHTRDGHAAQVKLSASASAAAAMYRTLPATVNLSVDGDCIECWFYVDIANFSYFNVTQTIRLGESSSVYWQRQTFGGNMVPGWNVARWTHKSLAGGGSNWAANGGISSWANIDYIYIGWTAPSTGDMAITYCSMKAASKGMRAAFLMTFDDGNASVYTVARSIMNARGIHGTAYVVADQRDGGYMTAAQLQTLGGDGHYIGNHTYSHEDLTTLSESQIQTAVSGGTNAIQALSGLESHGVHAAYPLGYYTDEVQTALYKMGNQKSWRLTGGVNHDVAEGHAGPLNIRSQSDIEDSAYASWQNHIDVAYYTGEAFIGLVHDPGGAVVSTQEFTDICEYAAVTRGMWSPNIEEWWNQLTDHTGSFTTEAVSAVSAAGSEGVVTREGAFTTEALSTVSVSATKTDWTAEGAFTTEAVSSISASATKTDWTAEAAFTTEAFSTVTTTGTKTDWIADPTFTTEVVSSVSVTGSETGAAIVWEASLTSEVFSTAVVTVTKTDWTAEGTLTTEGFSAVLVTGSETVYGFDIYEGQFTSEAVSYMHVSITVLRSPAFTTEAKSRVQVIPTLNDTVITEPVRVTMRRVPPLRLRLMRRYYE